MNAHLVAPEALGPRGIPMFHFGGPGTRMQRVKGDFAISYQYYGDEPVMAIARHKDQIKKGVLIVALSAAWQYADSQTGDPTEHCAKVAAMTASRFGMEFSQQTVFKLCDIIVDGIPDLLKMPPKPDHLRDDGRRLETVGEATLTIAGKRIDLGEVKA